MANLVVNAYRDLSELITWAKQVLWILFLIVLAAVVTFLLGLTFGALLVYVLVVGLAFVFWRRILFPRHPR